MRVNIVLGWVSTMMVNIFLVWVNTTIIQNSFGFGQYYDGWANGGTILKTDTCTL